MIEEFKESLKRLAKDPGDPFHEKISARIGKKATAILEARLRSFILIMPMLVSRMYFHWHRHGRHQPNVKKLGSFVITYLYHPKDFLSDEEHGLFGYLDDAYLVAIVYEKTMGELAHIGENLVKVDADSLNQIDAMKKYVKAVIPKEIKQIEKMVDEIQRNKYDEFSAIYSNG